MFYSLCILCMLFYMPTELFPGAHSTALYSNTDLRLQAETEAVKNWLD